MTDLSAQVGAAEAPAAREERHTRWLVALVILAAVPGKRYPDRPPQQPEKGTAPPGWIDG